MTDQKKTLVFCGRPFTIRVIGCFAVFMFLAIGSFGSGNLVSQASAQGLNAVDPVFEEHGHPFHLGLYGGYAINFHRTQADIFVDCPECGQFSQGTGSGFAVGLFGELPVLTEGVQAYLGINYAQRGGTFGEVNTGGLPILDPQTSQYVTLTRKHSSSANLGYVVIDLGLSYRPFESFPIYIRGALNYNPALGASSSYHETEEIISPQGVLYPENNQRTRDVASGLITGVSSPFGIAGTLGYPLPVGHNITASPEISYYQPLSSVVASSHWKVSALQLGVALRYHAGEPEPLPPPAPPPPAPPEVPKPLPPVISLATLAGQKVDILETIVTETFPILPYVFYDSASSVLPARYVQIPANETRNFAESDLPHQSLDAYHQILNVVGSRMLADEKADLTLRGTTDGKETVGDEDSKKLAIARAQSIKDYLVANWAIAPERITVESGGAPTFPSTEEYPEGIAENRRVELSSSNDELLRPILHERFKQHVIHPSRIPLTTTMQEPSRADHWKLTAYAKGKPVWQQEGTGAPPTSIPWELDQKSATNIAEQIMGRDSLTCELIVTAKDGLTSVSRVKLAGEKSVNPFELSRLSLIVFDFDKFEITEQNRRMISHFVSHSILPSSQSTIVGSTDNLGEARHNQQLSEGRAFAVRDLILKERSDTKIVSTDGVGASRQLYSNDAPEGRYYCRTVTVEVQTPLEDVVH